ncbi:MAG TPA: hypothetical protein VM142_07660 [Acidimicrobiales bacterium]|nr:hypothetical protein [Acidimicrobiales bacterium]
MSGDNIDGFDPFVATLHAELRSRQIELAGITGHAPSRRARLRFRLTLWRENRVLDTVLWTLPVALLAAAGLVLALSWPWSSSAEANSHAEVVIGCASVVFLGAILAEAISLPLGQIAQLGPGLTQSLIRRPSVWLAGLSAVPLSIFLFWLGTRNPDGEAALGGALLAGAAFSLYWAMTRHVLAAADPFEVARSERRRLLRNVGRFAKMGADLADAYMADDLPTDAKKAARADRQRQLAAGPIRQLRSGARRLFARGATDEGLMFTDAMIEGFVQLADDLDGAVGDYNGLPGEVVESIEGFVSTAMSHHDDFVAVQLAERLNQLSLLPIGHRDIAAVRLQARGRIRAVLDATWDDKSSRVPAACAGLIGQLPNTLIRMRAHDDAGNAMHVLQRVILRAVDAGHAHIGGPAMSGFIDNLGLVARIDNQSVRSYHLERWSTLVEQLFALAGLPDMSFARPQDQLIPGMGLAGGSNLQEVLVTSIVNADGPCISDVLHSVLAPLEAAVRVLAGVDQAAALRPISRSFDLALCLNHVAVANLEKLDQHARTSLAQAQLKVITSWAQTFDDEHLRRELRDEHLASHVWSNLASAAYVAGDLAVVRSVAERLVAALGTQHDQFSVHPYDRALLAGVALFAGLTTAQADTLAGEETDPFSFASSFEPVLGRGPACVRATVFVGDPADEVNAWLVSVLPALGESS